MFFFWLAIVLLGATLAVMALKYLMSELETPPKIQQIILLIFVILLLVAILGYFGFLPDAHPWLRHGL